MLHFLKGNLPYAPFIRRLDQHQTARAKNPRGNYDFSIPSRSKVSKQTRRMNLCPFGLRARFPKTVQLIEGSLKHFLGVNSHYTPIQFTGSKSNVTKRELMGQNWDLLYVSYEVRS